MSKRGQKAKEIQETIKQVLLHEWDPIGVSDIPEAQDEYDSYVGGIYRLLASGASEYQIIERLYNIETVSMGLPGNRAGLKNVAEKLANLVVSL
ncbi:MAG: hypothetical protein M3R15_16440 [Acidobacteriota bacterium]|nr:hypothetical protein [Acidobacteriota bacterium]